MRDFAQEFKLTVKDGLRDLRYVLRSESDAASEATGPFGLIGDVALRARGLVEQAPVVGRVADGLLREVDSVASSVLSGGPAPRPGPLFPRTAAALVADDGAAFTPSLYGFLKYLLRTAGVRNAVVFEHAIDAARRTVIERRQGAAAEVHSDEAMLRLASEIAVALVAERPVRRLDLPQQALPASRLLLAAPNAWAASVIGLATAIASYRDGREAVEPADVVESAMTVVTARFDRFHPAIASSQAVADLTRLFAQDVPHLP